MKVIKHGLLSNGIFFRCERCNCEYMVEDKNDWRVKVISGASNHKYVEYYARCPDCSFYKYIGINPYEFNKYEDGYMIVTNHIFDRPDWAERYEVKSDEQNNV